VAEVASDEVAGLLAVPDGGGGEPLAALGLGDSQVVAAVVDAAASTDDTVRFNAFRALVVIGDAKPAALLPHWDRFAAMLASPNAYHRSIGLHALARAAAADDGARFDGLRERFLGLLDDDSVMVARYLVQQVPRLVAARPDLAAEVTKRLLAIDETHHPAGRRDLLKADIVEAFGVYLDGMPADLAAACCGFAADQLGNPSPKARAAAKAFVKRNG
jgi:hypothetical protein